MLLADLSLSIVSTLALSGVSMRLACLLKLYLLACLVGVLATCLSTTYSLFFFDFVCKFFSVYFGGRMAISLALASLNVSGWIFCFLAGAFSVCGAFLYLGTLGGTGYLVTSIGPFLVYLEAGPFT